MGLKGLLGLISVVFSFSAFAGNQLHLKKGSFDPAKQSIGYQFSGESQLVKILQFKGTPSSNAEEYLRQLGVKIHSYIPDNAWLVELPNNKVNLEKVPGHRASINYSSSMKISNNFSPISIFNGDRNEMIYVRALKGHEAAVEEKLLFVGNLLKSVDHNFVLTTQFSQILNIATWTGVEFIEPVQKQELHYMDMQPELLNARSTGDLTDINGYESGTKIMGFEAAWSRGYRGDGEIVSYADTGLDTGERATLAADFKNVPHGYHFGFFTKTWRDPMGHGTHVAGSIVGAGVLSGDKIRGGAFAATMIPEGMWSDMMKNLTVPPVLSDLFNPIYQDGARVHNNSWGSPRNLGAYDGMAVQVDEFVWNNPDMLIVFAAGNSGEDKDKDGRVDEGSVSSPSTAKNALSVGASENLLSTGGIQRKVGDLANGKWATEPLGSDFLSDNENGIAVFSSRGPTRDGRLKPDVVAPGTNILSNCSRVKDSNPLWGKYNDDYCYSGGTSMAAPLAAGAAVVAREFLRKAKGEQNPSAALVKATLMHTAKDMYPGQFGEVGKSQGQELLSAGPNFSQGFGRVDMDGLTAGNFRVYEFKQGVEQGQEQPIVLDTEGYSQVKFTMVYSDRPGTASASRALVNDLALDWELTNGTAGGANDRINNFEQGIIDVKGSKTAKLLVRGERVQPGGQPFSLVVTLQ